jgi:hypothetical protein
MSEHQRKSWFGRNWLWFVPLTGCMSIIVLFVLGIGAAFFGVSKMLTESEPVEYAIALANKNEAVAKYLGTPVTKDGLPQGNISYSNDDGKIDVKIPVNGSKDEGYLIVKGIKNDGIWIYEEIYILIKENQQVINLLEKEKVLEQL